ncbi:hypothetical protein ACMAUO_09245 [Gluconacetobacter sp. Hr-1-5]|uniref:hypothetical protein n=1 Tax=Gluconacetobacter sp. Hr-1-5 TaxID=3395370 RepID=UPI003B52D8A6
MKLVALFVRRPVTAMLPPVSDLPDVSLPVISVFASSAGASPETMARMVAPRRSAILALSPG